MVMEDKHAYLIIAHTNYNQLLKLLNCLDDKRNSIFLHLDTKMDLNKEKIERIIKHVNCANIQFIERNNTAWGAYSLIACEAELIKAAVNSGIEYTYVHLISGLDLPIKNQDYIHSFFQKHNGEEFIEFMNDDWINKNMRRLKYFYPLQEFAGNKSLGIKSILYYMQRGIVKIQQYIGINRLRKADCVFKAGSQWFSVTFECAKYINEKMPNYLPMFEQSLCADEYFIQTIIYGSKFYKNSNKDNMRLIKWAGGSHPIIFTNEDINYIASSDLLFARKFDEKVDNEIIERIVAMVC